MRLHRRPPTPGGSPLPLPALIAAASPPHRSRPSPAAASPLDPRAPGTEAPVRRKAAPLRPRRPRIRTADAAQARPVTQNTDVQPYGIADVCPRFPGCSDSKASRPNASVWPMVRGERKDPHVVGHGDGTPARLAGSGTTGSPVTRISTAGLAPLRGVPHGTETADTTDTREGAA
ncbi:hypothetical protein GCM10022252_70050 [Streptosporangium oxazolinicum]|uniref:Uncharacterized protein n=1 Tax=Streptosporangium oxazolinicum TaxID=909287 RepID=A0ABP8BHI7_9ACTN